MKYERKRNLEGKDSQLVIIDFEENREIKRIINIYRCFNPNGNVNPREKFKYQLNSIKNAMIPKTVLLGDFNLDYEKFMMIAMRIKICLLILMKFYVITV